MRLLRNLAAILMVMMLAACGQQQSGEPGVRTYPPPPTDMIAINLGVEPSSLDPSHATDLASFQVLNHLFEPLIRLDADSKPQPALATSWEHSDNFMTWTFHLRQDNKWHNGDPVTANDFVYALRRVMDPKTASLYAMTVFNFVQGGVEYNQSGAKDASNLGVRAIDDYTLEIKLAFPAPYFDTMLNHSLWFPLHQKTIEKYGDAWIKPENYVGNGPYKLVEYRTKDRVVLQRADTHYDADKMKLRELQFLMIEEGNTEMAAFLSGTLHVTDLMPHREAPKWKNDPAFQTSPMIGTYFISFNQTEPPFNDVHLRKAFSKSINRQMIVDNIVRRGEISSTGYIPHGMIMPNGKDYRDLAPNYFGTKSFEESLQEAKEELKAGGYSVDGSPGKKIPRIEYIFNDDDLHEDIGQALQFTWKNELGVDVDLQLLEWTVLLTRGSSREFQIMRSSWIGDYLDPVTFLEIFETGHGKNNAGYSNPRYDELLSLARQEGDWEKRLEYLIEAERLLIEEDCVIAPVFEYATPVLVRPELKGVVFTPLGNLDARGAYWEGQ